MMTLVVWHVLGIMINFFHPPPPTQPSTTQTTSQVWTTKKKMISDVKVKKKAHLTLG